MSRKNLSLFNAPSLVGHSEQLAGNVAPASARSLSSQGGKPDEYRCPVIFRHANLIATVCRKWLNFQQLDSTNDGEKFASEVIAMLAEKFFLVLETIRSHASDDRSSNGRSSSVVTGPVPQIPVKPPSDKQSKATD